MLDHHPVQTPRRYLLHQVFKCEDGRKKQTQKRRKNKSASSPSRFISGSVSTYLFSLTDCVGRHREPQTREIVLGDIGRQLLLRYWGGPQNMRITDFQKIICYWSIVNCTGLNAFLCQLIWRKKLGHQMYIWWMSAARRGTCQSNRTVASLGNAHGRPNWICAAYSQNFHNSKIPYIPSDTTWLIPNFLEENKSSHQFFKWIECVGW